MKRKLSTLVCRLSLIMLFMVSAKASFASHIVGGDLYYTWITGNTYRITVVLYGDCGPASASVFGTLPTGAPQVCVFNGSTPVTTISCAVQAPSAGTEITPVCPDSLTRTQCVNPANPIPGIKRFVYSANYTLPSTSANWRFVFNSNHVSASAGRAAAITNIVGPGGTLMQLEATLDNTVYSNTSPSLTVVPTPFFCLNTPICYTPGAIDPEGDSLRFELVPATNATGACTSIGGPVAYTGAGISATNPLTVAPGSFSFNTANGQVCFNPNALQRSIVVYKVNEYRDGMLVGSCMREMTFLVRNCTVFPPTIDTVATGGVVVRDGGPTSTSFHVCGDQGAFTLKMEPRPDASVAPPLKVTVTATGVPTGMTFSVVGNGTDTPHVTFSGNASLMAPGVYTFFLNLRDNACPLNGNNTIGYTLTIYPVPTIDATVVSQATCLQDAIVRITPGGTGKPWTMKVIDPSLAPGVDTIATFVDSVAFYDTIPPGALPGPNQFYVKIFTSVSTECALSDTFSLVVPSKLLPVADTVHPSHCGKNDGQIILTNLNAGGIDTVTYNKDGVPQTPYIAIVDPSGTLTIPNLRGAVYTNIVVRYGYCTSDPIGPVTLVDPPFTLRAVTSQNPTKCGFCDGWIKLHGLHPDQLDTLTYNKDGLPQTATSYYINSDSTITLNGMCAGTYTTFTVKTAGVCQKTLTTIVTLVAPPIGALFDTIVNYGCKGDTLQVINNSFPASDLTYTWDFGDGGTSTEVNPVHVYTNTIGASYTIKLYATNTRCIDSSIKILNLNHFVKTDYSTSPTEFVCQTDPVTFTNLSTGTGVDYAWYFADGTTANTTDVVHSYTNMGTYTTILVGHNVTESVHCYDTTRRSIIVDSNSILSLKVSGDVNAICRGQAVTLTAIYTNSGQLSNKWTMTDGFEMVDVNPVLHSFEGVGPMNVRFDAKFRACPDKTIERNIHVFDVPSIYLGGDTAMCPGSSPIKLIDTRNASNPRAKWQWSTEETTSSIMAKKPGVYRATVTVDGCSTTDSVTVRRDCFVDVPNIFTPNGDGVNDHFFPRRFLSRGVTAFKMSIYNRWGQPVYETSNTDGKGWDGALNGIQQPEGVYIYVIDVTFKDGQIEQQKGNVTVMR
ncbi:PKD domain-containing protein [Nemorincola caseinilytica]|uniref:PKD domain-containing protein n=1 Tax=Nemorincola caseinilytica TaxID=2054315 RepID=UPI0031EE7421